MDTIRKPAVSLPTGSGKTVIFTSLMPQVKPQVGQGSKTLILVNRVEIAKQTVRTINNLMPELEIGVEMEKQCYGSNPNVDVCVASIHSIHKPERLAAFDPKEFKLVIVDEAHHTAATTYQKTLQHFGIDEPSPKVFCVGVSATFFRKDKKSLQIFDEIVYHREATEMIDKGHLSKVQVSKYDFDIPPGYTNLKRSNNFLFSPTGLEFIVKLWKENKNEFHSTVVFCINKTHVHMLASKFREMGIDARSLTSDDKDITRNSVVEAFKNQEFPVLINCSILSEGTDIPCIDQIIFATPLGSPGLAMQMIGRGLRQFPGKTLCNTIFLSPMVKFDTSTGLLPELRGYTQVNEQETRVDASGEAEKPAKVSEFEPYGELDSSIESVNEEKSSNLMMIFQDNGIRTATPPRLSWIHYNGSFYLSMPNSPGVSVKMIKIERKSKKWLFKVIRSYPKTKQNTRGFINQELYSSEDLDETRVPAENFIAERFYNQLMSGYFSPRARWRCDAPTEAQLKLLEKFGLEKVLPHINKGQATSLISLKMIGGVKLTDDKVNTSLRLKLDITPGMVS